jgi:bifunctional non-homologous end joining protein LigD
VIFGEMGARKLDLARYYEAVAEALLPELRGRPISLIRCPRGSEKACFFQKHVEHAPAGTHKVSIAQAGEAEDELLVVESIEGVLGLVQFGAIEFHTWGAQEARMEQADRITLDLDPDPALNWKTVLEGARLVREVLVELALPNFIKTTGGKGLHIVIPLKPDRAWEDIRGFSKSLAEKVCGAMPQRFTMNLAKVNRRDKIFVDYLRNAREATTVCAFSARARAGAPVSVPLSWDELEPRTDVRGAYFNITNVPSHLTGRGADPWAGYDGARVSLGDFSIGERAAAH